ncbi:DUF6756 family protein [Adlercreutzia sp. ZJ304]|uniref:DUF6756 family protein n=1 Tax=Adlercreutzia sp. ZJ304 TaxID=2709791 RepID=UPI0013EDB350|nr:DUF6756 family protein [Adlercreutzia sp. ZJ304]
MQKCIRDEIENTINEKSINRESFRECPKTKYKEVINGFYYAFVDYDKYPNIELDYCWLHFRDKLIKIDCISENIGWDCMLAKMKELQSYNPSKRIYLILSQGWVYEGYIDSIIGVLSEIDGLLEDFYITTPQFDKLAAYCNDGECVTLYRK